MVPIGVIKNAAKVAGQNAAMGATFGFGVNASSPLVSKAIEHFSDPNLSDTDSVIAGISGELLGSAMLLVCSILEGHSEEDIQKMIHHVKIHVPLDDYEQMLSATDTKGRLIVVIAACLRILKLLRELMAEAGAPRGRKNPDLIQFRIDMWEGRRHFNMKHMCYVMEGQITLGGRLLQPLLSALHWLDSKTLQPNLLHDRFRYRNRLIDLPTLNWI